MFLLLNDEPIHNPFNQLSFIRQICFLDGMQKFLYVRCEMREEQFIGSIFFGDSLSYLWWHCFFFWMQVMWIGHWGNFDGGEMIAGTLSRDIDGIDLFSFGWRWRRHLPKADSSQKNWHFKLLYRNIHITRNKDDTYPIVE